MDPQTPRFRKLISDWRQRVDELVKSESITTLRQHSVIVITPDVLPLPGLPTTGAGLRAWGLGQGLLAQGYNVQFAMPQNIADGINYQSQGDVLLFDNINTLLRQHRPDFAIFQHWPLLASVNSEYTHTILDMHGPLLLETLYQGRNVREGFIPSKLNALRRAHFFTCAGERQRSYFYGWLLQAGFDVRQPLLEVVPFSLAPQSPAHTYPEQLTFVYGGVFLPWQDPFLGLKTLVETMESKRQGHLHFFGGYHPVHKMPSTPVFEQVKSLLGSSSSVTISPSIPRAQLLDRYCQSSVAWDVQAYNSERGMAFTSRTAEYLWTGLPVVHQNYSELANYIKDYEAGWLVDPENADQMRSVILEIMENPEEIRRRGKNAQRLAFEKLNWETTIAPIHRFMQDPTANSAQKLY